MKLRIAAVAALVCAVWFLLWRRHIREITEPAFETQVVEARTFRARYPANWEKVVTDDPRLGDKDVIIHNHPPDMTDKYAPWDTGRMALFLTDMGTGYVTVDQAAQQDINKDERPELSEVRFDNGIVAKTWTTVEPASPEIPMEVREYVFKGTNGHCYSAVHVVQANWKRRKRYDYFFGKILGSLEFKNPPAAK